MLLELKLNPFAMITESLVNVMLLPEKFVTVPQALVSRIIGTVEEERVASELDKSLEEQVDMVNTVKGVPFGATQSLGLYA